MHVEYTCNGAINRMIHLYQCIANKVQHCKLVCRTRYNLKAGCVIITHVDKGVIKCCVTTHD